MDQINLEYGDNTVNALCEVAAVCARYVNDALAAQTDIGVTLTIDRSKMPFTYTKTASVSS